jgi:hypothetical protein
MAGSNAYPVEARQLLREVENTGTLPPRLLTNLGPAARTALAEVEKEWKNPQRHHLHKEQRHAAAVSFAPSAVPLAGFGLGVAGLCIVALAAFIAVSLLRWFAAGREEPGGSNKEN